MSEQAVSTSDRFRHVIFRTVALALSHDLKKPITHISEYMSLLRNHLKNHSSRVDIGVEISYLNAKLAKYNKYSGDATKSLQVWADRIKSGPAANVSEGASLKDFESQVERKILELKEDISNFTSNAEEISQDSTTTEYIRLIDRNQLRITDQYYGLKELLVAAEEPQFEEVELLELLDSVITNYRKLFGFMEFNLSVLDKKPTVIRAMRGQILAVIQNLLENGIRFAKRSKEYDIAVTLHSAPFSSLKAKYDKTLASLDAGGAWVELHVRNKGVRIEKEMAEEIFILFVTTEHKNKSAGNCDGLLGGGSGIGLTVSRAYITAHRGIIFLNTDNNIWTDFVVLLPAEPRLGIPLEQLLAKFYSHI
jgi:signal transduction histidine kinase